MPISDLTDDEFDRQFLATTEDRIARLATELEQLTELRDRLAERIERREAADESRAA